MPLTILFVYFLPVILVQTGYLKRLINRNSGLNGTVDFQTCRLNWFGSVSFEGLSLTDEQDVPVARITSLAIDKGVWDLIFSGVQDTTIQVDGLELDVNCRDNSINLFKLIADSDEEDSRLPGISVSLLNASILLRRDENRFGSWSNVNAEINIEPQPDQDRIEFVLEPTVTSGDETESGTAMVRGDLARLPDGSIKSLSGDLELSHVPMEFSLPLIEALGSTTLPDDVRVTILNAIVDGQSDFQLDFDPTRQTMSVSFNKLSVHLPNINESVAHDSDAGPPNSGFGEEWTINGKVGLGEPESRLKIASSFAEFQLETTLPGFEQFFLTELLNRPIKLEGQIDLHKLADRHPEWIPLQDGTHLESGLLTLTAVNRTEANRNRLLIDIRSGRVLANRGPDRINWPEPINLALAIRMPSITDSNPGVGGLDPSMMEIEFLQCKSEFLTASGQGNLDGGRITVQGNLNRLQERLRGLVKLEGFQMAGDVKGNIDWKLQRAEESASFQLQSGWNLTEFHLGMPGADGWHEKRLLLDIRAAGDLSPSGLNELTGFEATIQDNAANRLVLKQRAPTKLQDQYQLLYDTTLNGNAQKWTRRINSLLDLGIEVEGNAEIDAVVAVTPAHFRFRTRKLSVTPCILDCSGLRFDEPVARGSIDLIYRRADGQVTSNRMTINSPAVHAEAKTFESKIDANGNRVTKMEILTTAKANRLSNWLIPRPIVLDGLLDGTIVVELSAQGTLVSIQSSSKEFQVATLTRKQDRAVREIYLASTPAELDTKFMIPAEENSIQFEKLVAILPGQKCDLVGSLSLDEGWPVGLTGTLHTDVSKLIPMYAPSLKDQIRMDGSGTHTITIQGPLFATNRPTSATPADGSRVTEDALFPPDLKIRTEWQLGSGKIFGLPVTTGKITARLARSRVVIEPNRLVVGNGNVETRPVLQFQQTPYSFSVPPGSVIKQAEIAPEVFHTWMRYVTPLLADATSARGKFSVHLDKRFRIPLDDPLAGNLDARLQVDSISVTAGPTGQALISVVSQVLSLFDRGDKIALLGKRPWIVIPQQEVPVTIRGGQVTHQRMVFRVGEVTVITSGTVDANQNINMLVSLPIESDWFAGKPVIKSLIGKQVTIPLRGNLSNPRFNLDLLGQLTQKAASGALNNLLEGNLKDLLGGKLLPGEQPPDKSGVDGNGGKGIGGLLENRAKDFLQKQLLKGLQGGKDNR